MLTAGISLTLAVKMSKETTNSDEEAGTGDSNRLHDEDISSSSAKQEALTSQSTAPAAERDNTSADVSTNSSISSKNTLGKIADSGCTGLS